MSDPVEIVPRGAFGTDGLTLDLDPDEILREIADEAAHALEKVIATGRDISGAALPPISPGVERARARAGAADTKTPLHATGQLARSVRVERVGEGYAVVIDTDDERMAALEHYGIDRFVGVPRAAEAAIDGAIGAWSDKILEGK